MHRHGPGFFSRVFLTDAKRSKLPLMAAGLGMVTSAAAFAATANPVENVFAENDAVVANINVRSGR